MSGTNITQQLEKRISLNISQIKDQDTLIEQSGMLANLNP